ncbi:MAG: hypothetical protein ABIS14_15435 [Sphingomonas sp.]
MKKSFFAVFGIGVACTACCLPFAAPLLLATGLSGLLAVRIAGVSVEYVMCEWGPSIALLGAAGLAAYFARLAWKNRAARLQASCDCAISCTPAACKPD